MGVEHYIVCKTCEEYIYLNKAYYFSAVLGAERPPVGINGEETGIWESVLVGGYWESRGLWFIWHHRGHTLEAWDDCSDPWHDYEPNLKEVFPSVEDDKIRERVKNDKQRKPRG